MHTGGLLVLCGLSAIIRGRDRKNLYDVGCTWVHHTDPWCTLQAWEHPYDRSCVAREGPIGLVRVQYGANRNQHTCGPVRGTTVYVHCMGRNIVQSPCLKDEIEIFQPCAIRAPCGSKISENLHGMH